MSDRLVLWTWKRMMEKTRQFYWPHPSRLWIMQFIYDEQKWRLN